MFCAYFFLLFSHSNFSFIYSSYLRERAGGVGRGRSDGDDSKMENFFSFFENFLSVKWDCVRVRQFPTEHTVKLK